MYSVEYYDDEDMRPCWCVVEWHGTGPWRTGHTVERCDNEAEAESLLHSYMLIHRLTMH